MRRWIVAWAESLSVTVQGGLGHSHSTWAMESDGEIEYSGAESGYFKGKQCLLS